MALKARGNLTIEFSTDNKTTWQKFPESKNIGYSVSVDGIDVTHLDSGDWKEELGDRAQASVDVTSNWLLANAILIAFEVVVEGATKQCHFRVTTGIGGTSTKKVFLGTIKSFSRSGTDVIETSFSAMSTGPVTAI